MDSSPHDNLATTIAIGLLAYVSADVAHHALGHAGACLASGGSVVSLSSVFVECTLHGAAIDLAGPFLNLILGLAAVLVVRSTGGPSRSTRRLFWLLVAGFNLLWFSGQLVFSLASRTDDWAWALERFGVPGPVRLGLIAAGILAYVATLRFLASGLAPYAHPPGRAARIVWTVWLTAGVIACATAALDPHPVAAILHHALPQSVVVSAGLLLVSRRAARRSFPGEAAPAIGHSVPWIASAALVAFASILLLGPGVAIVF